MNAQAPPSLAPLKGELPPQRLRGCSRQLWFSETLGEFVPSPLASPGGVAERSESFNNNDCRWQSYLDPIAGRLDGSSEPARLTEEGWRQLKYCLRFVQWYQPKIIADYFSLFKSIYHVGRGFHKTSTFLHSPNPSSSFRCTPSLFSHAPYGARQLPPGGSQGGSVRIRLGAF